MPTLILEHDGRRKAAVLNGRAVIGRRANSHIVVPDRTVSRIHAWIGHNAGNYFVVDSGSRVGTLVNGQALKGRHSLADGDQIRVGSALLTFHSNGTVPADAEELDLSNRATSEADGIFLDCSCGAPLWAPWDFAGRMGQCRYCGQMLELPPRAGAVGYSDPSADTIYPGAPSPAAAPAAKFRGIAIPQSHQPFRTVKPSIFDAPAPPPAPPEPPPSAEPEVLCGACQSSVGPDDVTTRCPECGVTFHADCWAENRGCSSYGCKQVGILDPKPAEAPAEEALPDSTELEFEPLAEPAAPPIEWEYVMLALALVSALVGLITFGIPGLLAGAAIFFYRYRTKSAAHHFLLIGSILICIIAAIAGIAFSWYWWLTGSAASGI